jgi:hypothetical protein
MERAKELFKNVGAAVLLLMVCIYLVGSSQAGHPLNHGEYARALDHVMAGVLRVIGSGFHWLMEKGR